LADYKHLPSFAEVQRFSLSSSKFSLLLSVTACEKVSYMVSPATGISQIFGSDTRVWSSVVEGLDVGILLLIDLKNDLVVP